MHRDSAVTPKKFVSSIYRSVDRLCNRQVLVLFPDLCYWNIGVDQDKEKVLGELACVYQLGLEGVGGKLSVADLVKRLSLPPALLVKGFKHLVKLGLVVSCRVGRLTYYGLSSKGLIILMAFKKFEKFEDVKPFLCDVSFKDDRLCFALLVIGYSRPKESNVVFDTLVKYNQKGFVIGDLVPDCVAESLLGFYSLESKVLATCLPNYLGVFKEFTTGGFQQVLSILLTSMKPTVEDYNWLVEFFGEVIEFYYNPSRLAYVNILAANENVRLSLENYKKSQEQQIRKEGSTMEVTFNVPSTNVAKFMNMPAHLRAMATRLIVEPLQFINQELSTFFWPT